ncbi:MAG: MgtC/SapB family protein [Candidatus Hydrogenedentes bacterium]|nr:MgtC/SapB family protein [Candidatus Hydrogenedentota bacterium]
MTIPPEALDASTKLLLAFVLSGLLGLERERKGRAAGLRTHIIVCLGSTLAMLASNKLSEDWFSHATTVPFDRGRVAAGILQGIGFIGAGTIINVGNIQRGLTTAAMVWFVGVLGIAIGLGYFTIAICATAFALAVVLLLERVSERVSSAPIECRINVELCSGVSSVHEVQEFVETLGYNVSTSKIDAVAGEPCVKAEYLVNGKPSARLDQLVASLQEKFETIRKVTVVR